MKYCIKITLFFLIIIFGCRSMEPATAQRSEVSFQFFFDNLSPYGFWTLHPEYGYVWIPDTGPEFTPYFTDGHWVYTNYGWTWVSYYEWGWAPFHYGRWDRDDLYGWFWVPGNDWGPAWVVWRRADGYYGWTPMSPGLSVKVNVNVYRDRPDRWIFVRDRDIVRRDIHYYHIERHEKVTIINNSTVINNTYNDNRRNTTYITGPKVEEVQRVSGRRVSAVKIEDNSRPGSSLSGDRLEIYRPGVRRASSGDQKPAPSKVMDIKDVRRRSSTSTEPGQMSAPGSNRRGTNDNERQPSDNPAQQQSQPGDGSTPGNRRNTSPPASQPDVRPSSPNVPAAPRNESTPTPDRRNQSTPSPASPVPKESRPEMQAPQNSGPSERRHQSSQPPQQPKKSTSEEQKSGSRRQNSAPANTEKQQNSTPDSEQGGSRRR